MRKTAAEPAASEANATSEATDDRPKRGSLYFSTLAQAAAAMNLDPNVLSWARSQGCPGFRNGKIYADLTTNWLRENANRIPRNEGKAKTARELKLLEEVRKLKIYNDAKEGLLQSAAVEAEWLRSLLHSSLQILERKLINEMPALCEQLEAAQIRHRCKKLYDEIRAKLRPLGERHAKGASRSSPIVDTIVDADGPTPDSGVGERQRSAPSTPHKNRRVRRKRK